MAIIFDPTLEHEVKEPCQVTIGQVKKLVRAMNQFLQTFVKCTPLH